MAELLLHGKSVATVFDLLGEKEDDITYALGWALAQSSALVDALLARAYGDEIEAVDLVALRLQETIAGAGRTDVEVETKRLHLILEAKRGWWLPDEEQLRRYAGRFEDERAPMLLVVAECSSDYARPRLPDAVDGVPVRYAAWADVARLVDTVASATSRLAEKRLLREFVRYLKGLMTMQNVTSNMVYVLSLGQQPLGQSGLTFKSIVVEHDRYFHPVGGGSGGWPKVPPNYLAFRYDGQLRQIRHVEGYEVFDPGEGCPGLPQLDGNLDWTPGLHYLYQLGPTILPGHEVKSGTVKRALRVWAALDLLLTSDTIDEARDKTKERLAAAGEL